MATGSLAKTHEHTIARKCALSILYAGEIRDTSPVELLENEGVLCLEDDFSEYAMRLVSGVQEHCEDLDARIACISENWSIGRMPILDKTIMRLALYEMLYEEDVPVSVSINEAVELAKSYGGDDDSPRFVNGMLGNIARQLEEEHA